MATNTTSFTKTPQGVDDTYYWNENDLISSGLLTGNIITLNVMANDLGGNAKTLFSIDDGNGHTNLADYDLMNADSNGAWESTSSGDKIRIYDGKIQVDTSHSLSLLGATSVDALSANDQIHEEFVYAIRLANGTLSQARVTVNIQGVNDAATITGQDTGNVTEDDPLHQTASGTLVATDVDHDQNSFLAGTYSGTYGSIALNATGNWTYTLNNSATIVQNLNSGQHPTDQIVVKSLDGTEHTVSVTVNGADENHAVSAPTDTDTADGTGGVVNENAANGSTVGIKAHATDPDATDTVSYSIVNSYVAGDVRNGLFTVDSSGVVKVADSTHLDYEALSGGSVNVTVRATSSDGTHADTAFAVTINNLDEVAPTITSGATATAINENSGVSQVVYTATSTDTGDVATGSTVYSLKAVGDAAAFSIDGGTGAVTLAGNPDFETKSSYSFTVVATDAAGNHSEQAVSLAINNVNEAPVLSQHTNTIGYTENGTPLALLSAFTLSDSDLPANFSGGSITVSLSGTVTGDELKLVAGGTVTLSGLNVQVSGTTVGTITSGGLSGGQTGVTISLNANATTANVNAVLEALAYDSTSDNPTAATRNATVAFSDGGHTGSGSALSDSATITINVTPVNDAPTLTVFAAPVVTVNEETQATITLTDLKAQGNEADVDGTVDAFVVKAVSSGTLLIGASAGTATPWAAGTNDTVDATHQAYWTGALNANGTLNSFTVVAKDNGGLQSASPVQVQASVTAVDDAPVNSVPLTTQSVAEDTNLVFSSANGNAITISDVDVNETVSPNNTAQVKLSVASGTLTLGTTTGVTITGGANASSTVTLQGTLSAINTALNGLSYKGTLNFNGSDSLSVVTSDLGHTGTGGPLTDTDSVAITVTAVNDAPVNTVPGTQNPGNGNTTLTFSGANAINISDVDTGANTVTVSLSLGTSAQSSTGIL